MPRGNALGVWRERSHSLDSGCVARKLVLYIEDNPANFALVRRLLESTSNYEVKGEVDGAKGLAAVGKLVPDLVLLDLDLPTLTGLEVLRRLKSDPKLAKIPVIVVTASVMQRERNKAMEGGATAFIEKPFDIFEFRGLVDEATGLATPDRGH